jgi:uncharacterized protein (TIGR04222 family)
MRNFVRILLGACAFAAVLAVITLATLPASAVTFGEHADTFDVTLTIQPDGLLAIHEVIGYDFGVVPRHGIFRDVPERESYDTNHDRTYTIKNVHVTASAGTPAQVDTSHTNGNLRLRIGDPDQTITGKHTYTISYTVKGALRTFPNHQELNWDAIGTGWPVPIDAATATVNAPANITRVACATGPAGSDLPCERAVARGTRAQFFQTDMAANDALTVIVAIPPHTITPDPQPILVRHWTLANAFAVRPNTAIPAGGLALLGVGAVGVFAYRKGRDRRFSGSAVDAAFGNETGTEEPVGVGGMDAGPVEFVPPEGVRPGQVGTLVDEHANLIDVTATIVDLAVRGWLTITEVGEKDYELAATATAGKGTLLPYEAAIMDALFASASAVKLSDLKYKWRSKLDTITNAMYDDVVAQGWYHSRPDRTRATWIGLGMLALLIGIGVTALVAWRSSFGLIALALVVTAIALLAGAGHMPARTPKGTAMLSRVRGFRRLFDEGDEGLRARFAEQHDIFSQYLPYAIVFGCADKWARAFEGLGAEELGSASWYHGSSALNAVVLAGAIDHFGTVATGTMYASQPSSSSSSSGFSGGGFSGGGGGGGGGGSW